MVDAKVLEKAFASTASALERLQEALVISTSENPLAMDATLQRFEFCFELMWKLFRKIHTMKNIENVNRSREAVREAGAAGWLKGRELWEQMFEDRNITMHTYNMQDAEAVYKRIKALYYPEFMRCYVHIRQHYLENDFFADWKDRED